MTDHKIGTREEWLAARLELLKAEKALTRRSDELAQWRQSCRGFELTRSIVSRPTRARCLLPISSEDARSSSSITSCSAPNTRWLPGMLCDRGRLQRLRRAPRAARRRDDCGLARPDRRASGLQAPHGLDVHVGVVAGQRFQLRLQHVVHRGAAALRQHRLQLPPARHDLRFGGRLRGPSRSASSKPRLFRRVRGHDRH